MKIQPIYPSDKTEDVSLLYDRIREALSNLMKQTHFWIYGSA
jgi:hypothetical protein